MKETPVQKNARLEKQLKEAKLQVAKTERLEKKVERLEKMLGTNNPTITDQRLEIKQLKETVDELDQTIAKLNETLLSQRELIKILQDGGDPVVRDIRQDARETGQSRIESFRDGFVEDKWGTSFFDGSLLLTMNPWTGESVYWDKQFKMLNFLTAYYEEEYSNALNVLDMLQQKKDECEISEMEFQKNKHELGMALWKKAMDDERLLEIFPKPVREAVVETIEEATPEGWEEEVDEESWVAPF